MILNREKTCCFTGHRKIENFKVVAALLEQTISRLIENGVTNFVCGGAEGWDTFAALSVIKLKKSNPAIHLVLILPCSKEVQTKSFNLQSKRDYDYIVSNANLVYQLHENYTKECMRERNQRMVEFSEYCVCYMTDEKSGTGQTVRMAEKNHLKIINLAKY